MTAPPTLIAHALRLMAMRPHSVGELRTKLLTVCNRRKSAKRRITAEEYKCTDCSIAVNAIMDILKSHGVVDDGQYAQWHVENRVNFRPRSRLHLIAELRAKYLPTDIIDDTLSKEKGIFDEVQSCQKALRKKARAPHDEQFRYLARKGYSINVITEAMKRAKECDDPERNEESSSNEQLR